MYRFLITTLLFVGAVSMLCHARERIDLAGEWKVEPSGYPAVTVALPGTTDAAGSGRPRHSEGLRRGGRSRCIRPGDTAYAGRATAPLTSHEIGQDAAYPDLNCPRSFEVAVASAETRPRDFQ